MYPKEEPRKQPPVGQHWYSVETVFIRKGKFEVMTENEEQAKQLVKAMCGMYQGKIFSNIPPDEVGWWFPYGIQEIGEAKEIEEDE